MRDVWRCDKGKMVGGATRERATREGDERSDKKSIRERLRGAYESVYDKRSIRERL